MLDTGLSDNGGACRKLSDAANLVKMVGSDIREQDIPRKHVEADFESGEMWPITREGMSLARVEKVAGIWKRWLYKPQRGKREWEGEHKSGIRSYFRQMNEE